MDAPTTYHLAHPIQFGEESITDLSLKPNARSMRGLALPMKGDNTILFEPYELAKVGMHMAGRPNAVLDMLHPADVMALAGIVMGFFGIGPETGTAP